MPSMIVSLTVLASSTAIAGTTIPATDSLAEPFDDAFMDAALPGLCGDWAQVDGDGLDVHEVADTQGFLDVMDADGPNIIEKVTTSLATVDVAVHTPNCTAPATSPVVPSGPPHREVVTASPAYKVSSTSQEHRENQYCGLLERSEMTPSA